MAQEPWPAGPKIIRKSADEPSSRKRPTAALAAAAVLAAAVFIAVRRDRPAVVPAPPAPAAETAEPAFEPEEPLDKYARLEGYFTMKVRTPRGTTVDLTVMDGCDKAASALQRERLDAVERKRPANGRALNLPHVALSVKRGALVGLVVEREYSFEHHELPLDSFGAENVRVSPDPDGRGLIVVFSTDILSEGRAVEVRATDYGPGAHE